ncbi:MAG: phosphoribosylformylglycinamidine cyclo-ligase [Clostridia bacterium]|nr:phosphoribosylformylglycinamidine cyclo-ligase [Clostridia bacterium]
MNKQSRSDSYAAAGVDITAGYRSVELMKEHIDRTLTPGVCSDVGGFGGLFKPDLTGMQEPVLVSGTDGVGTKLKLAFIADRHDTVGIDCVAMCVNDIICCGARPLFFLDYIACGKNVPERIAMIVKGVCEGCIQSGAALIGGETAEMPGFYPENEYDLAGYATGIVDKKKIIQNSRTEPGDVLIALPSSGVHSNGFSLVRKIFGIGSEDEETLAGLRAPREELGGASVLDTLLTPTKIYVKPVLKLLEEVDVRGISHITGGGFYENIPRSVPEGLCAVIDRAAVKVLPIFELIARTGNISERDMFNTFNMGVGMCITVARGQEEKALEVLRAQGEDAYILGEIAFASGEERIVIR